MRRGSGILCHVTSLPSAYGIGDLGPEAYRFVDFLTQTRQTFWQILPLNPTDPAFDNSPYHSISAFAFNPWLISPEMLVEKGLLSATETGEAASASQGRADYEAAIACRRKLFHVAFKRFTRRKHPPGYEQFCAENEGWLDDYACFVALKAHFNRQVWAAWPPPLRDREPEALKSVNKTIADRVALEKFLQYMAFEQWRALREYCDHKGIQLIGDMPIYVDYDSADCWGNPHMFKLNDDKQPSVVAGVPPDYFSATGQRWGNPVYRWDILRERRYDWWVRRLRHTTKMADFVRIDHFRGLVAYWEIPAAEKTAVRGEWVEAPAVDFLQELQRRFPILPIIAEDLGVITPDVREIMSTFGLPGMKILLFAFGEDMPNNPYIPHNLVRNCIVYTGTHDNNTVRGWFDHEATREEKTRLYRYLGREISSEEVPRELIRMAMMSVADVAIIPLQDFLGLGIEGRMNRPASRDGNWRWRIGQGQLTPELASEIKEITETFGRA